MLMVLFEDQQVMYKTLAEMYGITLWNVSSENIPPPDMKELSKSISKKFGFLMILKTLKDIGASMTKIMAKHANNTLSTGDWDMVIGNTFLQVLLSCMQSVYPRLPFVSVGVCLETSPYAYPQWPWPGSFHEATTTDNMKFKDRFSGIFYNWIYEAILYYIFSGVLDPILHFCPSVSVIHSLTIVGSHIPSIMPTAIGFEYPLTISPLTDYVGPLVSRSPAPLLGELGEWLKSKPNRSVVYISMGSVFFLDEDGGKALLEGVMKTNYSLLWSLRKSNQWILEGLDVDPDRVLISDWTPQLSVLGSKAIHSAILHGGFNGLSEALWNGVPVIVFPQMGEQAYNAGRVHFNGLGIHLDTKTLSSSKIAESLRALDTGEYRSKVAKLQKAFRIAGGVKRAADLVEFYEDVGYAHLVPAYAKYQWSWVQYYNADVYEVIVLILAIVIMCLTTCCKCICRKCKSNKAKME